MVTMSPAGETAGAGEGGAVGGVVVDQGEPRELQGSDDEHERHHDRSDQIRSAPGCVRGIVFMSSSPCGRPDRRPSPKAA